VVTCLNEACLTESGQCVAVADSCFNTRQIFFGRENHQGNDTADNIT
jgi:hypothetical protein